MSKMCQSGIYAQGLVPSAGLDADQASKQPFIASMGIYVFKKQTLVDLLKKKYPGSNDFGGEIIPMAAAEGQKVVAYLFNDYWEDIGTIKSFFDANLALAQTVSSLLASCWLLWVSPW